MLIVLFVGQIECYNLSSRVRSSREATFVNPVGISIFDGRIYVSDPGRETISSVELDLSSEHIMQRNVQQPGVLRVYTTRYRGRQSLVHYVAAKATCIRLLHGKIGFLGVFRP